MTIYFELLQKITIEAITPKTKSIKPPSKPTQKSILAGAVRKRVATDNTDGSNAKAKEEEVPAKLSKVENSSSSAIETNGSTNPPANNSSSKIDLSVHDKGALKCIGILPGIGKYKDSSDSEKSTDTDEEYDFSDFDWVGRKAKKNHDSGCDE